MKGVDPEDWLGLLQTEYLDGFIREGGAAVKFVAVDDDGLGDHLMQRVVDLAQGRGFVVATVDAARTRVHLMQHLFSEVARQVPWQGLAGSFVRTAYDELGYTVKDEQLDVDAVAEENGLEPPIVRRDLYKGLQKFLRRSDALAKDFRWAMFWLCESEAHLQGSPEDVSAILDWLRGDLRLVSALKQYLIFRRIGRHNARSMLTSLGGWTRLAGRAGLVLVLDLRQLGISRRSNVAPDTNYYTLAGAMDCYEVLRQLIDDTDDLQGVLCLVVSNPSLFDDERRGVKVYKALYERVWPDVALRQTPNPLSSLVTLERS